MAKPVDSISVPSGRGAFINASIWENQGEKDGKTFTTFSVTIEKRYQKDGNWHSASSFNADDLLTVAYVANQSFELSQKLRAETLEQT